MATDLVPVQVDPNSAGDDFWRRYHAFRRARHLEVRPEDPIEPDEIVERKMRDARPFEIREYYEMVQAGRMVSWFEGHTVRPGSPGYAENRDFFEASWAVIAEKRRQGIGSAWLPIALEVLDRHGCRLLDVWTIEESGHAFLLHLGAEPRLHAAENRLELGRVDWSMVRRWVEDGAKRSPHTRVDVYVGDLPESIIEEYARRLSSLLNTIPFEGLEHGQIVITPPHVRDTLARMRSIDVTPIVVIAVEEDGTISGITDVAWSPHTPTLVQQRFTGVSPDARGRGIGKWIKALMLEKIRDEYPQARWIATGNAESNAPMLAINHKLGFKQHRAGVAYQISRDALAEVVRTL